MTLTNSMMKAAVGTAEGLVYRDVPRPSPKKNEVLVRARAASLNRADLNRGAPQGDAIVIPGLDFAGEIVEVGGEVSGFKVGQRVLCSAGNNGAYAEFVATDWGRVLPLPDSMSFEEAATLPVALITMHNAIATAGRLKRGETVMIQGASTGVGLLGMQIAKLLGAGVVIGTSTNAERRARLTEFGADVAIDTTSSDWPEQVRKATGGKGVDLIVDQVSGPYVNQCLDAAALLGRIVNVGRLGGASGEFDFNLHALKRIDYIGVTFRTRTLDEVREISRRMKEDLWEAVTAGKLRLPRDKTFPLSEADAAQRHMRGNNHFGKIILTM